MTTRQKPVCTLYALLTVICVDSAGFAPDAPSITFSTLLAEMRDRATLPQYPNGNYTMHQASSVHPDLEAEGDFNHFIRTEQVDGRTEQVMLEDDGPGAIVRCWFGGTPDCGVVRIYIDGARQPIFEGSSQSFFGDDPKIPEPLSHHFGSRRHGYVSYWPIPYDKTSRSPSHRRIIDRGLLQLLVGGKTTMPFSFPFLAALPKGQQHPGPYRQHAGSRAGWHPVQKPLRFQDGGTALVGHIDRLRGVHASPRIMTL